MCHRPWPLLSESPVREPIPKTVLWECAEQARMDRLRGAFKLIQPGLGVVPCEGYRSFPCCGAQEVWIRPERGPIRKGGGGQESERSAASPFLVRPVSPFLFRNSFD